MQLVHADRVEKLPHSGEVIRAARSRGAGLQPGVAGEQVDSADGASNQNAWAVGLPAYISALLKAHKHAF